MQSIPIGGLTFFASGIRRPFTWGAVFVLGRIDEAGRTLIPITPGRPALSENRMLDAWIDTGFTGDLVLPGSVIDACDLPVFGIVPAVLA
ncbi:MAG: hypothetical protein AAF958_13680, partial [Planctomycetota bacterium]